MSAEEDHDLINADLIGMILVAMETTKLMRKYGRGVFINVDSQQAFTSEPNRAICSTTKAGLIRFTKIMARGPRMDRRRYPRGRIGSRGCEDKYD